MCSSDGEMQAHVDVAAQCVGVRADGVGFGEQGFGAGLLQAGERDMQIDVELEAAFRCLAHADFGAGLAAAERQFLRFGQILDRVAETRGVAQCKELLRVGASLAAAGGRQFEAQATVVQSSCSGAAAAGGGAGVLAALD